MKCHLCGYAWQTKSVKMYVSCPSCMRKTKNMDVRDPNKST